MKKIILSLAAVLAFTLTSDAQTRKGTVLLGAGSEMSNNEWTTLAITPKVGYFVQDGVAIGALINFQSHNTEYDLYELNNNLAEIGVFGRYYVSNNLFSEIALTSSNTSVEDWMPINVIHQQYVNGNGDVVSPSTPGAVASYDGTGGAPIMYEYSNPDDPDSVDWEQVVENSTTSLNLSLGLGYTIVWREHFAIEPYMNLIFRNGDAKMYNEDYRYIESVDIKGTDFNLGVNFSLFF